MAAQAHEGLCDKAGAPYVLHSLRVMLQMSTTEERITAVLHDVVEDTKVTLDDLRAEGFSEKVMEAVDALTRRKGSKPPEPYDDFILRSAANPLARRVKLADLRDNCDLSRFANPSPEDHRRAEKYHRSIDIILALEDSADAI